MKKLELKYLDDEINNLKISKGYDELTEYGKSKLASFIEIRKQLTLTDVVKQSKQFFCDCGKNKPVIKEPAYVHCTWCEKTYIETK